MNEKDNKAKIIVFSERKTYIFSIHIYYLFKETNKKLLKKMKKNR